MSVQAEFDRLVLGAQVTGQLAQDHAWDAELQRRYPALPADLLRALAHRHGTRAVAVLGDARTTADLGTDFGAGLTERELCYLQREEWASTVDDVLWRRTKCGLSLTPAARERVREYMER